MQRDVGDIIDRWSISKLKAERIGNDENKEEEASFSGAIAQLEERYEDHNLKQFCNLLYSINDHIWQLESGLKSGKEELKNKTYLFDKNNSEALAKIGTATILIRNFNSLRVQTKNIINTIFGCGFQDIKKNHLSED